MRSFLSSIVVAVALAGSATLAVADPLPAKNLQWAQTGEIVIIPAAEAPEGIAEGDTFELVDAGNAKVTGTGTVVGTVRDGGNDGPITGWRIRVDSVTQ